MSEAKWRNVWKKRMVSNTYFWVLLLISHATFAQNLCNQPAGTEVGGFTLLTPAVGCSPFNVKIQDNSGGTDIQYYYYYTGQSANQLNALTPTTDLEETYFASTRPTVYTILQKGKKNGKDMYACKNITVRPNNQPLFSYNSCNNRILNIVIPDTTINDFDSYKIDWGDNSSETINSLPYEGRKVYAVASATKLIKIEGIYTVNTGCSVPPFQTVNMSEGGNYANIDKIELGDDRRIVEGNFTGLDLAYRLFKREVGLNYNISIVEKEVKNGSFNIDLPSTEQVCFSVFRNSGGCFESAGEVCTVALEDIDISSKVNLLSWQQHPVNIVNNLFGSNGKIEDVVYNIIRTNSESGVVETINNVVSPYSDIVDCKVPYCYKIEVVVTGYPKFGSSIPYTSKSISNEVCVDREAFTPPALTSAFVSVNSPNSAEISYTDNSGWTLLKDKFRLLRFEKNGFVPLDSSTVITGFADLGIAVTDSSYCYKINYTDECGSTSLPSPEFCTIYLSSADQRNIDWTTASPYAEADPTTYEIIYFEETTGAAIDEAKYPFPSATHAINLDLFEEVARYQVRAVDANGVESFSNTIEIPIRASIYLPNAFTPNNDSFNNEFIISGNTKRITDYTFTIYNRWGEAIFSTDDLATGWNGRVNDNLAPPGYYTYQINAKTNTGEAIEQKGVVLLMR